MKLTFKILFMMGFLTLPLLSVSPKTVATIEQIVDMHHKIQQLDKGFSLIFVEGKKQGHDLLQRIQEILFNNDYTETGKKLNKLAVELNAIFKTVKNIITTCKGKSKLGNFIFELAKTCNLEQLFKDTIAELEAILAVEESAEHRVALVKFITYLRTIQPIWHSTMANKTTLILNLGKSL